MGNPADRSSLSVPQQLDRNLNIVVLMSGKGIVAALKERGFTNITPVDMDRNVAQVLAAIRPDVVFNALHGTPGEDGTVQGLLDLMQIPYTHTGLETPGTRSHQARTTT